jgi:hypothetical protein
VKSVDFSGVEKWEGRPQEKKEQDTERRLDASAPDFWGVHKAIVKC